MRERVGPESDLFCITCGGPDPLQGGECARCVTKGLTVVRGPDKRVSLQLCRHCGAVPVRDAWRAPPSLQQVIKEAAVGALHVLDGIEELDVSTRLEEQDRDAFVVHARVSGAYRTVPVEGEARVEVRVHGATCPACSRRQGGYFEATLQVRREGRYPVTEDEAGRIAVLIEEEVQRVGGVSGSLAYLLKVEANHDGFDYFFGTMAVARAVAKRLVGQFGAKVSESATIHTRREGRDVYRLTIAAKIPEGVPGAFLGLDGEVLEVLSPQGNRLLTRTVPGREKRTLDERQTARAILLEPREVELVFVRGGEGELLDPESYKSVPVRVPEGVSTGAKVRAVKYEGQWHVLEP